MNGRDECAKMATEESLSVMGRGARLDNPKEAQEILNIAKRIDQFVTDNGWSWCTMTKVYRILKSVHE